MATEDPRDRTPYALAEGVVDTGLPTAYRGNDIGENIAALALLHRLLENTQLAAKQGGADQLHNLERVAHYARALLAATEQVGTRLQDGEVIDGV